eukprot:g10534.t1
MKRAKQVPFSVFCREQTRVNIPCPHTSQLATPLQKYQDVTTTPSYGYVRQVWERRRSTVHNKCYLCGEQFEGKRNKWVKPPTAADKCHQDCFDKAVERGELEPVKKERTTEARVVDEDTGRKAVKVSSMKKLEKSMADVSDSGKASGPAPTLESSIKQAAQPAAKVKVKGTFCAQCGTEAGGGAFCEECGAQL